MSDDIMKEQAEMVAQFRREFPQAITLDDTMRQMLELKADRDRWAKLTKQMFDAHGHYAGEESWCDAYMSDTAECDCGYQQLKEEYEKAEAKAKRLAKKAEQTNAQ